MVKGDTHNTNYNNAWMGIYNGGSQTNAHVWWTWDLGDNPSVKLKRMTNDWTWRTGSAEPVRQVQSLVILFNLTLGLSPKSQVHQT